MNFRRLSLCLVSHKVCKNVNYRGMINSLLLIRTMSSPQKNFEEELVKNPYYEKYAMKINDLQRSSPEDFKARVEDCHQRKATSKFDPLPERGFSAVSQPKDIKGDDGVQSYKSKLLNDIMKVDLLQEMTAEDISKLWATHFKDKDGIAASIPIDMYNVIREKGKKFPVFVLPLPRGQGYEFFVCQVERDEVHFTSLINYQTHKENAPECLTIVHYTDLLDKGIVLMRGEFNKDILNASEALCLANQFQLYYGKASEKRLKLLERLNCNPNEFKHMDLIAELESLSLESS